MKRLKTVAIPHSTNRFIFSYAVCNFPITQYIVKLLLVYLTTGTALAQWLRCCATNRKVAGSIPESVIGIFH